jgi:heme/copper-type cytochrome/quinol oxidase subunit 2
MKFLKKHYYSIIAILLFLPSKIFAQVGNMNVNLSGANPIKANDIYGLVSAILDFVVKIGAVVVVFFIIYAGFQFVTAQGSEDKISKAKTTFFWTIVGALILLGALTLSNVVCNTANQLGANVSCGR